MLDKALEEALEESIKESGQPESVTRRITAWLREMSQGTLTYEENTRFFKDVCNELKLGSESED